MKPRTLSRRVTLAGVGVLTAAALTVGTTAFAGTETTANPAWDSDPRTSTDCGWAATGGAA
ncbi:hypothetical protein [Streptomyces sp. B21-083]|uniref:hypothetical protein n=1 Tax=Streptomyces sp. B21-083 TaxID=3039410 RepID=UPI002FEF0A82